MSWNGWAGLGAMAHWFRLALGRLFQGWDDLQMASDCFARALEAELTMPLRDVAFERTLFSGSEAWSSLG